MIFADAGSRHAAKVPHAAEQEIHVSMVPVRKKLRVSAMFDGANVLPPDARSEGASTECAKMRMVRENDESLLGSEELMRTIDAQIAANSLASAVAVDAANLRPQTTALVAQIEEHLATVEWFSRPRTTIGGTRFLGMPVPFASLFLRLHALVFRDQRNANAALILALRHSLQLNIQLAANFQTREGSLDARPSTDASAPPHRP